MTKLISFAAVTALLLGGTGLAVAESANFETKGFPISLHQVQVTGLPDIVEAAPTATLVAAGMPASPHQLAVLSPRNAAVQVVAKRPTVKAAETGAER
ncbi:MAG TPA: hypothetical protein VHM01_16440 [Alphaproteobacteria bacterium]|nr:hypothetical protein [Alphaproteobacteria bacterium]